MTTGRFLRIASKLALRLAGGIIGLALAFLIAALIGTVWTSSANVDGSSAKTRTVFILSNGYHTDIALPVVDGVPPAGLPVRATDLAGGLSNVRYLAIGWGSEAAYTSLVSITDLSLGTIATALSFDRSVVHVLPFYGAPYGEGVYQVDLSEDQYRRLTDFIAATFTSHADGRGQMLADVTHGYGDIFYHARPRFSLFYSCNAWTGDALREAGIPVGIWTPFAQSLEWALAH
jgi:uncharacterized protein (TIGR02117 family)